MSIIKRIKKQTKKRRSVFSVVIVWIDYERKDGIIVQYFDDLSKVGRRIMQFVERKNKL